MDILHPPSLVFINNTQEVWKEIGDSEMIAKVRHLWAKEYVIPSI